MISKLYSLVALSALALVIGCAAPLEEEASGSAESDLTSAQSDVVLDEAVITCRENVDHGAEITFFADQGGKVTHAEYTETTIVDTTLVSNMNVCVSHQATEQYPDAINKTVTCNDVAWIDGFAVELYEGGFAGIPSAKLYKIAGNAGERLLTHSLMCRYATH